MLPYPFPTSTYPPEVMPSSVDEIEVENPAALNEVKAAGAANTSVAKMRLEVNSFVLQDLIVTITVTRLQNNAAVGPVVGVDAQSSNGAVWPFTTNDGSTPPWEGKWTRDQIAPGTVTEFSITFKHGTTVGTHLITFRVHSSDYAQDAVYQVPFIVS